LLVGDTIVVDRRRQNWQMAAVVQDRKMLPLRPVLHSRGTRVDWHWRDVLVLLPRLHRNMPTLRYVCLYMFTGIRCLSTAMHSVGRNMHTSSVSEKESVV